MTQSLSSRRQWLAGAAAATATTLAAAQSFDFEEPDGVMVFNPAGKAIGHIRLPERCANLSFAGKLRALAVTGDKRVGALPEVPTLAESVAPGFNSISWIGILAPAGTPREIVDKVSADVRDVVAADDVKGRLTELGAVPRTTTPAQFAALIDADRKRYAQIIRERKITVD